MFLEPGPCNVTCFVAESTATILPCTVITVSAAIPVTGVALRAAGVSVGALAGAELCVLPHPAKLMNKVNKTGYMNLVQFLIISSPYLKDSVRNIHSPFQTPRHLAVHQTARKLRRTFLS